MAPGCEIALLPGQGQRLAVGQRGQEFGCTVVSGVVPSTLFRGFLLEHIWKEAALMLQRQGQRSRVITLSLLAVHQERGFLEWKTVVRSTSPG